MPTMTSRKRTRIIASLRDQRLDVTIGIRTLADYHEMVDQTVELLAEAGTEPLPDDIAKWGR
jgi:hypothetical protein